MLQQWPLPRPSGDGDKEDRGSVLVIGGEVSLPGAVVLAGIAALRAGAGKLQIATCRSIAPLVGVTVPEALSIGLDETKAGNISSSAVRQLRSLIESADAILVGPGMTGNEDERRFVIDLLDSCNDVNAVLDAGALDALADFPPAVQKFGGKVVITPHAGEMARLTETTPETVAQNPEETAADVSITLNAVVTLKGSRTFIASPAGDLYCYESGDVGLATSGSGDTLAGVIAGLVARGASPLHAALWGVFLHGSAGNRLAKRIGRIGYLARELLDEIPPIMNRV